MTAIAIAASSARPAQAAISPRTTALTASILSSCAMLPVASAMTMRGSAVPSGGGTHARLVIASPLAPRPDRVRQPLDLVQIVAVDTGAVVGVGVRAPRFRPVAD